MKNYLPLFLFVLVEIIVVGFILLTAGTMPGIVASHFDGVGQPNGFMSNAGYVVFMIVFALGIPSVIVLPMLFAFDFTARNINIPNKEYWLSEQKKGQTIQVLQSHMAYFGILISLFIGYVHWLLINANGAQPAQLSNGDLYLGMAIFLLSLLVWGFYLVIKFKQIPKV